MPAQPNDSHSLITELLKHPAALALITIAMSLAATTLHLEGRSLWCPAGDLSLWSWNIWSQHNSQHVIDPYSCTHVLHGVLEFWIIGLVFRRIPLTWRLFIAVLIESSWEIAENSTFVIERYRAATISLSYFGDSIVNSISDILFCTGGFLIAYELKFWRSVALFLTTEAVLTWWIHDSLLINIIMLIYPIEAIKVWQMNV
ncbi:MAG: DUF2585 family protein [Acidobacteriota bacterium]